MELKPDIGETAGEIWTLLSSDGAQTLAQLKKRLKGKGDTLDFAVGWLAREDKIEMTSEKKTTRIQLKN